MKHIVFLIVAAVFGAFAVYWCSNSMQASTHTVTTDFVTLKDGDNIKFAQEGAEVHITGVDNKFYSITDGQVSLTNAEIPADYTLKSHQIDFQGKEGQIKISSDKEFTYTHTLGQKAKGDNFFGYAVGWLLATAIAGLIIYLVAADLIPEPHR